MKINKLQNKNENKIWRNTTHRNITVQYNKIIIIIKINTNVPLYCV